MLKRLIGLFQRSGETVVVPSPRHDLRTITEVFDRCVARAGYSGDSHLVEVDGIGLVAIVSLLHKDPPGMNTMRMIEQGLVEHVWKQHQIDISAIFWRLHDGHVVSSSEAFQMRIMNTGAVAAANQMEQVRHA